jgi:O-antigen ligase
LVFDRTKLGRIADGLAVALAVSLPWSTSATGILAGLWLIALIPTLTSVELRNVLSTPGGGLPVLLWALAVIGTLWALEVPLAERIDGLGPYHKLLTIPLLMAQFRSSTRGRWVLIGFLASCGVLLVVSWLLFSLPGLRWRGNGTVGVPVKDYIAQGSEFTVCIFLLAGTAVAAWHRQQRWSALAMSVLALAFLTNLLFVATSRTALVAIPLLLLLFALMQLPRKGAIGVFLVMVMAGLAWAMAPNARGSLMQVLDEVRQFQPEGERTRAGERLEYWRKSVGFVTDAPLIGHGTGSTRDQFRRTASGQSGMAGLLSSNPHNQTLAVAIQLGMLGTAVLMAMWIAHLLLFRGPDLVAWVGFLLVAQNIAGSLFNSHLFDFTQGWGYAIGVGVAGGAMLRRLADCGTVGAASSNRARSIDAASP